MSNMIPIMIASIGAGTVVAAAILLVVVAVILPGLLCKAEHWLESKDERRAK